MNSFSLFKTVLSKHPPASNIFIHSTSDTLLLFAYVSNSVHISKFSLVDGAIRDLKHDFNGQTLNVENNVVSIFCYSEKFYGVDRLGTLFSLSRELESEENADYDLFEDSPEGCEKWNIGNSVKQLTGVTVLSTCIAEDGRLALLAGSESKISLELVDISDGSLMNSFLIRSPGISNDQMSSLCFLQWIPEEKVDNDFFTNWFKEGRKKSGLFIITLPDGMVIAFFPESGDVEYLYVLPSNYVAAHWDFSSDPVCAAVKLCSLSLITSGGMVFKLNEVGEVTTSYFPLSGLRSVYIDESLYVYLSDWNHSHRLSFSSSTELCISLPLKGILCWGGWGNRYTLALSKHGALYCIDNTFHMTDIPEILPDSSHTADLIRKIEALEEINQTITKYDSVMEAVNLVNKNLQFSVSAQTAYVRGREYTIRLQIKLLTDGIDIDKEKWLLAVKMSADSSQSIKLCYKLQENLQSPEILTQLVTCCLPKHPVTQLALTLQLFYTNVPPLVTFHPTISVGRVYMDPSYFILPASEIDSVYLNEPDLNTVLSAHSSKEKHDAEKEDTKLCIALSEDYPADTVFKNLLMKSKPLWRTSEWNEACEKKQLDLTLANQLVTVEVSEQSVIISGKDTVSCFAMKQALLYSSPKGCKFIINPAEATNQLEIYRRSCEVLMHMDKPPIENIQELRQLLRKNITSKLTL